MYKRPNNFDEIKEIGIPCAFENQEHYFIGAGDLDMCGMPVYIVDKHNGNVIDSVGDPDFALDYDVSDELDPNNPKVIRKIDPKTIKF